MELNEKVYLLTDGCMWEQNKKNGTFYPHAIEVVDIETGAVTYIRSGSKIRFVEGQIQSTRTQEAYNKATQKKDVSNDGKGLPKRKGGKTKRKTKESKGI